MAFSERVKEDLQVSTIIIVVGLIFRFKFILFCVQQLRTVVAENLPDDHSHQNIEKIFNVAGWFVHFLISLLHPFNSLPLIFFINSVKTIRICHPQDPSTRSKVDSIISTKVNRMHIYVYIYIHMVSWLWFGVLKLHALVEFENPDAAEKAVCYIWFLLSNYLCNFELVQHLFFNFIRWRC